LALPAAPHFSSLALLSSLPVLPSPQEAPWFRDNVLYGITRPYKKFRVLYEWVEDEIDDNGSILVSEVREQAGILVAQKFGTYKKFEKLGERMKKFLGLKCISESGKPARWIYA
jgi:hypothetical protein